MSVNQIDQNPLLLKIQRIVNEMPENEGPLLNGLDSIFPLMSNNYISNRRTLRSNLEKFQLSYYQDLLASFGDVKKRLDSLDTCINSILETCLRMNGTLTSVKSETVCLVEEAQKLRSDSKVAEIKAYLLELLVGSYQISAEDALILSSKISHIDDTFFSALLHGKEIKNICKELLQSNELTFSCSLMNEATEILDRAYENLYEWAQNECMKHVHETPEISPYLQRALSELQNKPVLLKYSLDEYANARRKASVKFFLDVLSVEIDSNSTIGNHSVGTIYTMHIREKPRDHVRIVSDILACVHQITASEREYINSLCKNCHDTLIADLKIICLDTITESLCSHLKLNMENMLVSHHDAVTLYKMNNIMRFYQHTFRSLIKSTASLNLCLDEVQKLCKRLILSTLKQFVKQTLEQPDHPNLNLSPNELITDTLQLLIQMVGDQDISLLPNDEVKVERAEVIDCLVSPLITYCEKSASLLNLNSLSHIRHLDDHPTTNPPDNPSVSIYLANCFNAIQVSLSGVPFTSSQVEQVALKLDNCLNSLVVAQVSFILERTGLLLINQRLGTVQDPNVPQYTISQFRDMLVDFNNYLSNPDKLCLPDINKLCSQQLRRLVRRRSADQIHSYYQSVHQAIMNVTQTCSESDTTVQLYTPQHVAELILNF
ncbi:unnamed protein product [Schistosoma guineensis]|nr:unnamed protein product [Schistosoma guineensis]